jgi:hypothetical protein
MMKIIPQETIEQKIYLIRGQKVMLDSDLARLYAVETKVLNQAVKRNITRFPSDFMFALTRSEIKRMSQFVTSLKFSKSINVFTEQGVAMLSSVLRSEQAILVNVAIMRTFVRIRQVIGANKAVSDKITELERKLQSHDKDIILIFQAINKLMAPEPKESKGTIGFQK